MLNKNVHVRITGLGGTFSYELHTIISALRKEGFDVEVKDDHPSEHFKTVSDCRVFYEERKLSPGKVVIETSHAPWGG